MNKKFLQAACLAAVALTATACGRAAPDAGEAAVLTSKPWIFGHGGVEDDAVTTGMSITAFTTSVDYVQTNPKAFVIQYNDMMSSDGIPLDFAATAILQVTDPVELVRHFDGAKNDINGQPAWYVNNIEPVENNLVRDAFKTQDMNALAITASGATSVEGAITKQLNNYVAEHHIPIKVVNFVLGRVNPPQGIKQQRTLTAEETQRKQTEIQTRIAEDNRKAAETARASADDAYRTAMNMTPEQFVELQRIKMMEKVCDGGEKNGVKGGPRCTFVVGNASALVNTGTFSGK